MLQEITRLDTYFVVVVVVVVVVLVLVLVVSIIWSFRRDMSVPSIQRKKSRHRVDPSITCIVCSLEENFALFRVNRLHAF